MRISDWSSDVCSSDLDIAGAIGNRARDRGLPGIMAWAFPTDYKIPSVALRPKPVVGDLSRSALTAQLHRSALDPAPAARTLIFARVLDRLADAAHVGGIGRAPCRERGCQYV